MGKTIIQTIGPLYGEVVNGTVFGRPNGSVYVPVSNKISLSASEGGATATQIKFLGSWFRAVMVSNLSAIAESQDLSNYIERQVFTDEECTDLIASASTNAGLFNTKWDYYAQLKTGETAPENGDIVYCRCQLMSANGIPVATSNVISLEVVV